MSAAREKLQDALRQYTVETLLYIETVKQFCENICEWVDDRTKVVLKMEKAFQDYLENEMKQVMKDSVKEQRAKLNKKLVIVLNETLRGLEKLNYFLEAVEMLAVTSLHVFMVGNPVINLPEEISLEHIQEVIIATRQIRPVLLMFKRDARDFFSSKCPRLEDLKVIAHQLDRYIQTTQWICENLQISHLSLRVTTNVQVNLDEDLTDDEIQRMLRHIEQLTSIRMDPNFRLVSLFPEDYCSAFIKEFTKLQPKMLQSLEDLEKIAVQLDSVAKGAKISSVAGSSVGAVGGVLSILGLALIPVTAGVSLPLITAGAGCGVFSGLTSIVSAGAEIAINRKKQEKVNKLFLNLSEDLRNFYCDVWEVTARSANMKVNQVEMDLSATVKYALTVSQCNAAEKTFDSIVDVASASLRTEKLVESTGKVIAKEGRTICNVPRVAGEIPDIGKTTLKGPLALSKFSRGFLIGVNALCLGLDLFFVINDSISLYEGIETKMSQSIRVNTALLRSKIDGWEKIHDSLSTGLLTSENNIAVLNSQFYF